ncbi:hypothetical protein N9269_01305 [Akkermansiaceae bacterium]|nr:hypothetical protein [Akkermansiaceae bacterium]
MNRNHQSKNVLIVEEKTLLYRGHVFHLDDLHSSDLYAALDKKAAMFWNETPYVNELYLYFSLNYLALEKFIVDKKIDTLKIKTSSLEFYSYLADLSLSHRLELNKRYDFKRVVNIFKFHGEMLGSAAFLVYLMLKIPRKRFKKQTGHIAIVRSASALDKVKNLAVSTELEDPKCSWSLYRHFKKSSRIFWIVKALLESYKQIKRIRYLMGQYHGSFSKYLVNSFYGKRLVHLNFYRLALEKFFKVNSFTTFYSFNNLDRFSGVEEAVSKAQKISLVSVPHGLEYGFKLPKEFAGDKFYATSALAAAHLNQLYGSRKFVFDGGLVKSIFGRKFDARRKTRIVFFTEAREVEVNHEIIQKILPFLRKKGLVLCLKIHPKDILREYKKYNLEIIKDLAEAITNNLCFARKSTILLEALYNNSQSSAIILNSKDDSVYQSFPSLQTKEINVAFSIGELKEWIIENYENGERQR